MRGDHPPRQGRPIRYRYHPPKNMLQAMASVPLLAALVLAGLGFGIMEMIAPEYMFYGACLGAGIGMAVGMSGVWQYLNRSPKPPSEIHPSEEGTATDPDLYNVRDRDH